MEKRTITQLETINETRIVLRSSTTGMRNDFQTLINNRIQDNNPKLPSTPTVESIPVIDRETIFEINNLTTSKRRMKLMRSIQNNENINDNSYFLIMHSTSIVRTYLHNLLIRSASNLNIDEEDLFRIGNIFLYTIANLNEEGLVIMDIIQHLRENMIRYNTNQVIRILENHIPIYNDYLEIVRLARTVRGKSK